MKKISIININFSIYAIAATLIFIILLPCCFNLPVRDSGIFLYEGQSFLRGEIPYRDVWDNKPPMINFINALGLFISNGSLWGVVLLQYIVLYVSFIVGFISIKKRFGLWPAIFGSFAWVLSFIDVFEGGNLTEEYALICQFLSLYLFDRSEEKKFYSWRGFLIGGLFAISFLFKQNLIGIWIAIGLYLILKNIINRTWRSLILNLGSITLGFISIFAVTISYFWIHNSLYLFWDVAFRYNFLYSSSTTLFQRIGTIAAGAFNLSWSPFLFIAWILAIANYFQGNDSKIINSPLLALMIILYPIEMILSSLSGRGYPHYFMAWLPVLFLLLSYFVFYVLNLVKKREIYSPKQEFAEFVNTRNLIILIFVLLLLDKGIAFSKSLYLNYYKKLKSRNHPIVEFLKDKVNKSDYILVWGHEGDIYYLSRTRSPSRFFTQIALLTDKYSTSELVSEFISDIINNPPKYIIDTPNTDIPPLDKDKRDKWLNSRRTNKRYDIFMPNLDVFFNIIETNYDVDKRLGNWTIYSLKKL
jgi:hypothetical protein